jgi:hypothetical protein
MTPTHKTASSGGGRGIFGGYHLGVEVLTDFPLQVAAQLWAEVPYRVRLSTSIGEVPALYVDAINGVAVAAGAYSRSTADLVGVALSRAITWRARLGWRPFARRGGYLEAGYGVMAVSSAMTVAELIERATGRTAPAATLGYGFRADAHVHTVSLELGWMWLPWRDLTIRTALGFSATVGADVIFRTNPATPDATVLTRVAGAYVEGLLKRYLYVPTLTLAVGWRLF